MRKNLWSLVCLAIVAGLVLTGCGGSTTTSGETVFFGIATDADCNYGSASFQVAGLDRKVEEVFVVVSSIGSAPVPQPKLFVSSALIDVTPTLNIIGGKAWYCFAVSINLRSGDLFRMQVDLDTPLEGEEFVQFSAGVTWQSEGKVYPELVTVACKVDPCVDPCPALDPCPDCPILDPVCALNSSATRINVGESATLSWTTQNAVSAILNQGIGAVAVGSGTKVVRPTVTTNYILTVTNADGKTHQCSLTIQVVYLPLSCSINANPLKIYYGYSATLSWTTQNATSATLNQGIGAVAVGGGTKVVHPTVTTQYTLTVTNAAGETHQCSVVVEVVYYDPCPGGCCCTCCPCNPCPNPDPVCALTSSVSRINVGESATLSWTTQNTVGASLNQGIGTVAVGSGTKVVRPTETTNYVLTVTNADGRTHQCSVIIVVNDSPPSCTCNPALTINPSTVTEGVNDLTFTVTQACGTSFEMSCGVSGTMTNGSGSAILRNYDTTGAVGVQYFTAIITKSDGTTCTARASLTVNPEPPDCNCNAALTINPSTVTEGVNDLTFTVTQACGTSFEMSCGVSGTMTNGVGSATLQNYDTTNAPGIQWFNAIVTKSDGGTCTTRASLTVN